jgi:2-polyprenyl-3-methyl-5-hydroxy-6-metoxy-1,4-benzoquinol methylase
MEDESTQPKPDAARFVHEVVLELLRDEKRGKLLDLGAGEGALSKRLLEMGFDVESCDLNPGRFKIAKNCTQVDLNELLPYQNETFDFIICVEVIEHLRNPWLIVSECKRILKKKGKLIITTPNIFSVISRVQFLILAEHVWFPNSQLNEDPKDLYHALDRHINPIGFSELEHILRENGLTIEKLSTNNYIRGNLSSKERFISLLLTPLVKRRMIKRYGQSFLSSDELLFGDILILKSAKL